MREITMKIIAIISITLGTLLIFLAFSNLTEQTVLTGQAVADRYTYTKAICNKTFCQDYEIVCENKEVVSMKPTGKPIQLSEDWRDTRDEKADLCG